MAAVGHSTTPSEPNPTSPAGNRDSSTPSTNPHSQAASSEPSISHPVRSNSISTSHLNPRSCVTCRRRKVRCNKENPCSNCQRAGIDCIFPGPGRAPRKTKKPPDAELLARLRKLESVVTNLGAQVDDNGVFHAGKKVDGQGQAVGDSPESPTGDGRRHSIDKNLGRLVISEDRSRYVSNRFWASMGDEIAEMRDLLDAATSEDELEEYESPHDKFSSHQGFIFGYSSLKVDLRSLHPSPSQIFVLWEVFKENVDPIVRILHRPTAKNILLDAASSVEKISKPAEAFLFAIYFGAVVSLTEGQCRQLLDEDKAYLIKKYRFAIEQALARADFLNSSSLMVLQAFVFFLVFVRHIDDSRLVWSLGGLAIHLAQALGIHRDGSQFGLTPFDIEMRRRLWWHISILDNRSAEEHGTDPTFTESFYDTKLPLNINDDDLYPEMKEPPKERHGASEMTFCLIRFELSVFSRRLNLTCPGLDASRIRERSLEEKESMIDACHRRIEEKYLQHCDMTIPIFWVSATVARLILAKMWLMVHHPRSFVMDHAGHPLPSETKDRLFVTSIEVIEFSYLLQRNENTAKWGWLFRTYMQWQSVAFVLSEIVVREPSEEVERAWKAIDSVYWDHFVNAGAGRGQKTHKGMLWRPMRGLMAKARGVRGKQVKEGRWEGSKYMLEKGWWSGIEKGGTTGTDGSAQKQSMRQSHDPSQNLPPQLQQPLQQIHFDFQTDPWLSHMSDNTNPIGATAEALQMDFDIAGLVSPVGSDGSSASNQRQKKDIPRAMASVFGPSTSASGSGGGGEMQGVIRSQSQSQSPTLSVGSDFGVGTSAADLGVGVAGSMSSMTAGSPGVGTGEFDFNNPNFFGWNSWNPGVGDFIVAPQIPDPMGWGGQGGAMMEMENGMGMGMQGGENGGDGSASGGGQKWY